MHLNNNLPDVSVIIPCFNAGKFLGRTIDSVLGQTGVKLEIIVVDDGSTDESIVILENYRGRIRLLRKENAGVSLARNDGLRMATGRYVRFLDADDEFVQESLSEMLNIAEQRPGTACIGKAKLLRNGSSCVKSLTYDIPFSGSSGSSVPAVRLLCQPTQVSLMLLPRSLINSKFSADSQFGEEFQFVRKMVESGLEFRFANLPVVSIRDHDGHRLSQNATETSHIAQIKAVKQSAKVILDLVIDDPIARQSLGTFCWARARDCFRMGWRQPAQEYLQVARSLGGSEVLAGSKSYKFLLAIMGPRMAEAFLQFIKVLLAHSSGSR
jgi:hypothetical protein